MFDPVWLIVNSIASQPTASSIEGRRGRAASRRPRTAPPQQSQPPSLWLPSPARGIGAGGEGRTDLDGLGDAAFIATGGIYVLQGERVISIGAGDTARPEVRAELREAANIAVGRLDH